MSRTLQFRRYNSATVANTIGANGELIINSTNQTITVHDGVTPGGFPTLNSITDNNIDQYARTTANSATNLAQSSYNYANTIGSSSVDSYARTTANSATSLAQGAYNNSNTKFSSSGGTISGNVTITNNLNVTNNTIVTNTVEANNAIFDGTLLTGLAARSSVVLPQLVAQFASNSATYIQTNSQNINPRGSADYVVTADNGNDTNFFIDLGLHGSQAYDQILTPYDGYLFVQGSTIGQSGGNLIIGTTSSYAGLETKFVAGGYANNNVVMRLGTYGANVVGNLDVTGTINVNNVLTVSTSSPAASPSITVITTQNNELRLRAVSNNWSYYANGSLIFPDNTIQRTAFTGSAIDQTARNTANTATNNITIMTGVNDTQNTRINSIETINNSQNTSINAAAQTVPQNAQSTNYVLQLTDAGKHIYYTQASNTILYIPTTSNVAFSNGSTIMIVSRTSSSANVTVSPNTGVTMYLAGNTTSASRNVTTYGMATLIQVAANTWFINGTGVS
jgi:hypothetical protein